MSSRRGKYSPEFKEAAVREVIDNSRTIAEVARSLDVVEQTLGNWVRRTVSFTPMRSLNSAYQSELD